MIELKNVTMVYPNGKGIFDIDFTVENGQAVGFLGPNGSGKTTTIRALLGFMRADSGDCVIDGKDCFLSAPENCKEIGFIMGEPAFPDGMTGTEYLNFVIDLRAKHGKSKEKMQKKMRELVAFFEFDPKGKIKKMSKGMKQKTAIVAAFLHEPNVYILDEPTSGLDPLMQNKFVELLLAERAKGKTILMSSHIFEEVEKTCEHIVIIKDGRIAAKGEVKTLKRGQTKTYIVSSPEAQKMKLSFDLKLIVDDKAEVTIPFDKVDKFIKEISKYTVTNLIAKETSLESLFLSLYGTKEAHA